MGCVGEGGVFVVHCLVAMGILCVRVAAVRRPVGVSPPSGAADSNLINRLFHGSRHGAGVEGTVVILLCYAFDGRVQDCKFGEFWQYCADGGRLKREVPGRGIVTGGGITL